MDECGWARQKAVKPEAFGASRAREEALLRARWIRVVRGLRQLSPLRSLQGLALLLAGLLLVGAPGAPGAPLAYDTAALNREPAVQRAFAAFYDMDYDAALHRFEGIAAAHPDSPLATDFVLDATLFRELNRLDLLDTTFYANDGFLSGKHTVVEDPAMRDAVHALADKAIGQANALLAKNNKDVDALYARGWARSLEATYQGLVQRGFASALKLAIGAKNDNEEALKIDPHYVDADLVVGTYQYVGGALPRAFRRFMGILGVAGSK